MLVSSGFLPSTVKTPAQAIAIALKGQALGWDPMTSFQYINIIQGKPTISSEGMLSLIYKKFPTVSINFTRYDSKGCSIEVTRPGGTAQSFKFDEDDAKAAGLLNKTQWKTYARSMYRSRCISEMARSVFPDALMGCSYTPEEIDQPSPRFASPDAVTSNDPAQKQPTYSSNQMYQVQSLASKPVFDQYKPSHITKMGNMLVERDVDVAIRSKVINEMHGKPSSELEEVIKKVAAGDFVESLDEDFEIPFAPKKQEGEVIDV